MANESGNRVQVSLPPDFMETLDVISRASGLPKSQVVGGFLTAHRDKFEELAVALKASHEVIDGRFDRLIKAVWGFDLNELPTRGRPALPKE